MYKKKEIITAKIDALQLPDIGIASLSERRLKIKGALPEQSVSARVKKSRNGSVEAKLLEVLERAPYETESTCPHSELCGGCRFRTVPYKKQLELKEEAVMSLFRNNNIAPENYRGMYPSPKTYAYRNKMEFSFGDTGPGGELSLGLRRKNSWYEVVHVSECKLIDESVRAVLNETLRFFRENGTPYYNTRRREGVLRHLVVRKSEHYGCLLVNLVTVPGIDDALIDGFNDAICALMPDVTLAGVLHTANNSLSDVVKHEAVRILYGKDFFYERVLGHDFKITPASFFQTNTQGAEILYKMALEFAGAPRLVYDLYCGTGTLTQIISSKAEKAIGIEIVPDAVLSARETSAMNGKTNAEFICGDVLKVIDELAEKPDLIVMDPPREGIHPKALKKILALGAERMIYISCNPSSLVRDLSEIVEQGYETAEMAIVDMFPYCGHVEAIVSLRL